MTIRADGQPSGVMVVRPIASGNGSARVTSGCQPYAQELHGVRAVVRNGLTLASDWR